ncbi:pseudouridine synthase [Fenollaria sporofastidiosus]|uniref:pseudouridine synthase n=1 Tax=Fenollaria sporofastidiosus TaxID=2811778 RepID=UPI001C00457E
MALNKPLGYVTTLKDKYAKKIISDLYDYKIKRIYPVGRLDANTTGLLLLTNDGQWSNSIMHPKMKYKKNISLNLIKHPTK